MKRINTIFGFMAIEFGIISCGSDGEDGQAYISLNYYNPKPTR